MARELEREVGPSLRAAREIEAAEARASSPVAGLAFEWLHRGTSVRVALWRCLCEGVRTRLSDERSQPWHGIAFPHTGAFEFHAEGRRTVIDPTCILYTSPGVTYRTAHPFGTRNRGIGLMVDPELLIEMRARRDPRVVDRGPNAPFPVIRGASSARVYLEQRELANDLLSRRPMSELEIEERALAIACEAIDLAYQSGGDARPSRRSTVRCQRDQVEAAKSFLFAHFAEPLRLEEIARAAAVSPFHLSRIFRRETGLSVHGYLSRLRLRSAIERVAERDVDIAAVAFDLGFSSHSHFSQAFGREFGVAPSAVLGRARSAHSPAAERALAPQRASDRRGRVAESRGSGRI